MAKTAADAAPAPAKPAALSRAQRGSRALKLDASQRKVLESALSEGEKLDETVQTAVMSFGRWLLGNVFEGVSKDALDRKTKNKVWSELVRRAGGPTLTVSRRVLYVALSLAAFDKQIGDQSWRRLDYGRKELLLPLATPDRLRAGAQHVSKWNLTQAKTRDYVTAQLGKSGKSRQRRITGAQLATRVTKWRSELEGAGFLAHVDTMRGELPKSEREKMSEEIGRLQKALEEVARALRGKR